MQQTELNLFGKKPTKSGADPLTLPPIQYAMESVGDPVPPEIASMNAAVVAATEEESFHRASKLSVDSLERIAHVIGVVRSGNKRQLAGRIAARMRLVRFLEEMGEMRIDQLQVKHLDELLRRMGKSTSFGNKYSKAQMVKTFPGQVRHRWNSAVAEVRQGLAVRAAIDEHAPIGILVVEHLKIAVSLENLGWRPNYASGRYEYDQLLMVEIGANSVSLGSAIRDLHNLTFRSGVERAVDLLPQRIAECSRSLEHVDPNELVDPSRLSPYDNITTEKQRLEKTLSTLKEMLICAQRNEEERKARVKAIGEAIGSIKNCEAAQCLQTGRSH